MSHCLPASEVAPAIYYNPSFLGFVLFNSPPQASYDDHPMSFIIFIQPYLFVDWKIIGGAGFPLGVWIVFHDYCFIYFFSLHIFPLYMQVFNLFSQLPSYLFPGLLSPEINCNLLAQWLLQDVSTVLRFLWFMFISLSGFWCSYPERCGLISPRNPSATPPHYSWWWSCVAYICYSAWPSHWKVTTHVLIPLCALERKKKFPWKNEKHIEFIEEAANKNRPNKQHHPQSAQVGCFFALSCAISFGAPLSCLSSRWPSLSHFPTCQRKPIHRHDGLR